MALCPFAFPFRSTFRSSIDRDRPWCVQRDPDSGFRTYTRSCDRISSVVCISICLYVCGSDRCVVARHMGRAVRGPVSATVHLRAVHTNVDVCFNTDGHTHLQSLESKRNIKKHTADVGLASDHPLSRPRARRAATSGCAALIAFGELAGTPSYTTIFHTPQNDPPPTSASPLRYMRGSRLPTGPGECTKPQPRCPSSHALSPGV